MINIQEQDHLRWPNTVCARFTDSVSELLRALGLWYANTAVDEVIPQFHMKWIIKLSFDPKITKFLVSGLFFSSFRAKKSFTKTFCMLFIFAMKPNCAFEQKIATGCFRGNELFSKEPVIRIS